ncbi:putative ribonuclease H-like domain-containing protein [Tanacetum coccineum]
MSTISLTSELSDTDPLLENVTKYQKLIGKLIYLTTTRPNIAYTVSCLSQFMHNPLRSHLKTAIKVIMYLKGSPDKGINVIKGSVSGIDLKAYSDADSARCADTKVNPIIYTSCIGQFWATTKVQTVNEVRQLQALVDKKRVIITESSIQCDLHLEDAGGTDCFPTTTIFEELARMGAKSTAWNEFSSTMASLIIYLATNQKFNLSKYIFDAMLGDMSQHKKIFVNPFHTKKVFANMKRAGKDFS